MRLTGCSAQEIMFGIINNSFKDYSNSKLLINVDYAHVKVKALWKNVLNEVYPLILKKRNWTIPIWLTLGQRSWTQSHLKIRWPKSNKCWTITLANKWPTYSSQVAPQDYPKEPCWLITTYSTMGSSWVTKCTITHGMSYACQFRCTIVSEWSWRTLQRSATPLRCCTQATHSTRTVVWTQSSRTKQRLFTECRPCFWKCWNNNKSNSGICNRWRKDW